jgi:MFS family permease
MPDRRWIMLAILFAARAATGFQFQSVGSVSHLLIQDLGLGYAQIGLLLGAYLLPGIVVAFPAGLLGQRVRAKSLGLAGLALMSLSGSALAHADHFAVAMAAPARRRRPAPSRSFPSHSASCGLRRRRRPGLRRLCCCRSPSRAWCGAR